MTRQRLLSHSEVSSALECQTRHAFAYTGRLTDDTTLKPKSEAPKLRSGRAWGRAVAAWHEHHAGDDSADTKKRALDFALKAMSGQLVEDETEQRSFGVFDQGEFDRLNGHLCDLLGDYITHATPIMLTRPEHELQVAIPSRGGIHRSNVYQLLAYLDGIHTDADGRDWIYEAKLRGQVQSLELVAKQRQTRWYAWCWREATGRPIAGIIVDERLDAIPSEVKRNKDGSLSKVQSCRPDDYRKAGGTDTEVISKLEGKRWEVRHKLILTEAELDEAGLQLTSAASLIHQLDAGLLYPIRNPSPMRCPSCAFRDICGNEHDSTLVDALFLRTVPKRERTEEAA